MFGFPHETKEDMRETRDFSFNNGFDQRFFNVCYPLPGTEVYEYLKEKYEIDRLDWKDFSVETSPYPVSEVSSREIMDFLYKTQLHGLFLSFNIYKDFYKQDFLLNFSKVMTKLILFRIFGVIKKIKQC